MMLFTKGLVLTVFFSFVFLGCSATTVKDYAFTTPNILFDGGAIRAKLLGKDKKLSQKVDIRGEPYELLIVFSTNEDTLCEVTLNNVKIRDVNNNTVIHIKQTTTSKFEKVAVAEYFGSYFNFNSLNLNYVDYELSFTYSFKEGCFTGSKPIKANLKFKTDYNERKLTFWDSLMGI
jgi:hypothetical protein